jgi:S1-C subfamily serine protease
LAVVLAASLTTQLFAAAGVEDSVVRIYATLREPEPYKPWTRQAAKEVTGSGVVIEGERILTCAHVVRYASQVEVQANQEQARLAAKVEAIALDMDLAVLKLDNAGFFATHPALARSSSLPDVKDAVMAYGYPQGGSSLSITKGIVSRTEFVLYNGGVGGLRVQIDAAVNPGNSGGPAVVGEKMVGLAFKMLTGTAAQNIGYIIPCEEIELFLRDIADGTYDGKPLMRDACQGLANSALRAYLKLDNSIQGVLVTRPGSDEAGYPVRPDDIVTRIGTEPLDNEGMIHVHGNIRVYFKYLVQKLARNGKVPLTIVRAGQKMEIEVPVKPAHPSLLADLGNSYPDYFVCGPLVFSAASSQYLFGFMAGQAGALRIAMMLAAHNPMARRFAETPGFEGEQLVVVTTMFPHKLTQGYGNPSAEIVKNLNGVPVKSLRHLVELLHDSKDEFIVIGFDDFNRDRMVFPRKELIAATDEVLNDNNIRSQGSPDTMAIWNGRPTE